MKVRSKYLCGSIALIAIILFFTGCTHVLNITEIPTLQTGSPLRGVGSKTFAFKEFKDIRNVEDPVLMMVAGVHKHILDQPPATLVAMWLKKELERNGHICVMDSPQMKADFVIEGTVYKFLVSHRTGMFETMQHSSTGVKLTISRISANSVSFVKSYEGEYSTSGLTAARWKIALSQALLSMIKEISTDPELIEFIKK